MLAKNIDFAQIYRQLNLNLFSRTHKKTKQIWKYGKRSILEINFDLLTLFSWKREFF